MSDWREFQDRYYAAAAREPDGSPFVFEDAGELSLHFEFSTIQSRMRKDDPDALLLDYTQTAMGFLLFQPEPRDILMIGLGGGSLAKYCHRHLPAAHFTAIEISPDVIALREAFRIPADGPRFQVVCADGADYVRHCEESVDVLVVDGFDAGGQPRPLCSPGFYDDCRAALREGGVLVVNLWKGDRNFRAYASRISQAFQGNSVVVEAAEGGNRIAFAVKGRRFPLSASTLAQRARTLAPRHAVRLPATAQKIRDALRHVKAGHWERD